MEFGREMWVLVVLMVVGAGRASNQTATTPVKLVSGPPAVLYSAVGCKLSLLFTLRFDSATPWRGEMVLSEATPDGRLRRVHACQRLESGPLACFSLVSGDWTEFPLTRGSSAARAVLPVRDRVEMADNGSVWEMRMEGWLRTRTVVVVDAGFDGQQGGGGPGRSRAVGWYFRVVGGACVAFMLLFAVLYHCVSWREKRKSGRSKRRSLEEPEGGVGKPPPSYTRLFPPNQPPTEPPNQPQDATPAAADLIEPKQVVASA